MSNANTNKETTLPQNQTDNRNRQKKQDAEESESDTDNDPTDTDYDPTDDDSNFFGKQCLERLQIFDHWNGEQYCELVRSMFLCLIS